MANYFNPQPQHRFPRQFWGGFFAGILAVVLIQGVSGFIYSRQNTVQHVTPPPQGSIKVILDDASLTNIMQIALSKIQNKVPVALTRISAQSVDGGQVHISATATTVGGISTGAYFVFTPTLDRSGQIQFQVNTVQLQGVDIPGIGAVMETAIDSQFQQYVDGQYRGYTYQILDMSTAKNQFIITMQVTFQTIAA